MRSNFLITFFAVIISYHFGTGFAFAGDHKDLKRSAGEEGIPAAKKSKLCNYSSEEREVIEVFCAFYQNIPHAEDLLTQGNYFYSYSKEKAFQCYRKSADLGNAEASYNVGTMYYFGIGMIKDAAEAFPYFRQAMNKGHVPALFYVGKSYFKAKGVECDARQALLHFKAAADKDYEPAVEYLGDCLSTELDDEKGCD